MKKKKKYSLTPYFKNVNDPRCYYTLGKNNRVTIPGNIGDMIVVTIPHDCSVEYMELMRSTFSALSKGTGKKFFIVPSNIHFFELEEIEE